MSLIARIQYVNFLTYSNPESAVRKPALRVIEFSPIKFSTAINMTNGKGKTNMVTALLYLLSQDAKLKGMALPLFTPRRCGAPTHIRVQLWDIRDDMAQQNIDIEQGPIDPRDIPNKRDQYVFGLCGYRGEEPKFYEYRGVLEDCPVYERTEDGYLYYKENEVQQGVKNIDGGAWNLSPSDWRSFVTSHIPRRVLDQQVKFHLAGGGDKSAQLHQIEVEDDESFGEAYFRTVIAPELLASTGELDDDPDDQKETFAEELRQHFDKMVTATLQAEQEKNRIEAREDASKRLADLIDLANKASSESSAYQEMINGIARDGALITHIVKTDPFPGLLDGRKLPEGKVGEIAPYMVMDKIYGAMILDAGLSKLVNLETKELNRAAGRKHIQLSELDESQVIDNAWNLVNYQSGNQGGGYTRKAYTLENSLNLIPFLKEIGGVRLAGAADALMQAFGWLETVADTNRYRREHRALSIEIGLLEKKIHDGGEKIKNWRDEISRLVDKITKYDQAKGAFEDLQKSPLFSAEEMGKPGILKAKIIAEVSAAERALQLHDVKVGQLQKNYEDYLAFCKDNPRMQPRQRLNELVVAKDEAETERKKAESEKGNAEAAHTEASRQQVAHEGVIRDVEDRLNNVKKLSESEPLYRQYFQESDPASIDISGGFKKLEQEEKSLALLRGEQESIRDKINELLPYAETYRDVYGQALPQQIDPAAELSTLNSNITKEEGHLALLNVQVEALNSFRQANKGHNPVQWLVDVELQRKNLVVDISTLKNSIRIARRQVKELMEDPAARPEEIDRAHELLKGHLDFTPLYKVIEQHCSHGASREAWLTHFSALLFSPVVDSLETAKTAATLLHEGQAMVPVFLSEPLKIMLQSGSTQSAHDGEIAYTWMAGIHTRMVHCIINPAAVENERQLANELLENLEQQRTDTEEKLAAIDESADPIILARVAAKAVIDGAENTIEESRKSLEILRGKLQEVERRAHPDSMASIGRMSDYLGMLANLGDDIQEKVLSSLKSITETEEDLQRLRRWHEERNSDPVRDAIAAMRKYLGAGGAAAIERISTELDESQRILKRHVDKLNAAILSLEEKKQSLETARGKESVAAESYNQQKDFLEKLSDYVDSDGLPFMEKNEETRRELENNQDHATKRKGFESQFEHAQRYIDVEQSTEDKSFVIQKATLENNVEVEEKLIAEARKTLDDNRGRQTSLALFKDTTHDTAVKILTQYRAIAKNLADIQEAIKIAPRFENMELYVAADQFRYPLEQASTDPFLMDNIRTVGRLASDMDLGSLTTSLTRLKKDRDFVVERYYGRRNVLCDEIISGNSNGLSAMDAEWLKGQSEFTAPGIMKFRIEETIQQERKILDKATTTLVDLHDKATVVLTTLTKGAARAVKILDDAMSTTPKARFHVKADVINDTDIGGLMNRLYADIERKRRSYVNAPNPLSDKRQRKNDVLYLNEEVYKALFTGVSVEFCHPSIWSGDRTELTAKGLSEGQKSAISLMWIAKLAEFRVRQSIDQQGGSRRQNLAALRKTRYFMILDGLFSNLSDDDLIDSAMESLRQSSGHFQLIGMIHHPRYINNSNIFPAYCAGKIISSASSKNSWLAVDTKYHEQNTLGVFTSYRLNSNEELDEHA